MAQVGNLQGKRICAWDAIRLDTSIQDLSPRNSVKCAYASADPTRGTAVLVFPVLQEQKRRGVCPV